jgi:hypothetical protein
MATNVIDTESFKTISADSIERGYNRLPSDELLDALDPDGTHVLVLSLPHDHIAGALDPEGGHVRTEWMMKLTGKEEAVNIFLDMTWENFNALPKIEKNEDGEWEVVKSVEPTVVEADASFDGESRDSGLKSLGE